MTGCLMAPANSFPEVEVEVRMIADWTRELYFISINIRNLKYTLDPISYLFFTVVTVHNVSMFRLMLSVLLKMLLFIKVLIIPSVKLLLLVVVSVVLLLVVLVVVFLIGFLVAVTFCSTD